MTDDQKSEQIRGPGPQQPVFLLPPVVTALCGLLIAVHLARTLVLNEDADLQLLVWLGFLPIRAVEPEVFPGGWLPLLWTPVSHAFLHAGWEHLVINTAWLAIFATPVARRYGTVATLVVFLLGAAVGALAFAVTTLLSVQVLVGASGGVAALTGTAIRFIFQPPVVLRHPVTGQPVVVGRELASIGEVFRQPRSRWFTVIWVALNAAVPLLPLFMGGGYVDIAWQAHLGGFALGFFVVPLLERRAERRHG